MPGQDVAQPVDQFEGWKAVVADAIHGRRAEAFEVFKAAPRPAAVILQELPELDQAGVVAAGPPGQPTCWRWIPTTPPICSRS